MLQIELRLSCFVVANQGERPCLPVREKMLKGLESPDNNLWAGEIALLKQWRKITVEMHFLLHSAIIKCIMDFMCDRKQQENQ